MKTERREHQNGNRHAWLEGRGVIFPIVPLPSRRDVRFEIHISFIVLRQISAHRSGPGKDRDPNLPWVHNDTHLRCLWPYMCSTAILWDGYYFLFSDRKLKFQRLVTAWYHLLGSGKGRIWVQIDEATMPMLLPLYPVARIYQKLHPFPLRKQSWIGQDVNSSPCCAFSRGGFILASCSGPQGLCEFCGNHVLFWSHTLLASLSSLLTSLAFAFAKLQRSIYFFKYHRSEMQNINGLNRILKIDVRNCRWIKKKNVWAQSRKLAQQNFTIGGYWAEKEEGGDGAGRKMGNLIILRGTLSFFFLCNSREICMNITKDTNFDRMEKFSITVA